MLSGLFLAVKAQITFYLVSNIIFVQRNAEIFGCRFENAIFVVPNALFRRSLC